MHSPLRRRPRACARTCDGQFVGLAARVCVSRSEILLEWRRESQLVVFEGRRCLRKDGEGGGLLLDVPFSKEGCVDL